MWKTRKGSDISQTTSINLYEVIVKSTPTKPQNLRIRAQQQNFALQFKAGKEIPLADTLHLAPANTELLVVNNFAFNGCNTEQLVVNNFAFNAKPLVCTDLLQHHGRGHYDSTC